MSNHPCCKTKQEKQITIALCVLTLGGLYLLCSEYYPLGLFLITTCLEHTLQYAFIFSYHREELSYKSFNIFYNHPDYLIAMSSAVLQYLIEGYFFPSIRCALVTFIGAVLVLIGIGIRAWGEFYGGYNYSYDIQVVPDKKHTLMTKNIYGWMRHPGYAGWFLWAVSSQIMLLNPLCCIGFYIVAFRFFSSRIAYEEGTLIKMFGKPYEDYLLRVPSGIIGIRGWEPIIRAKNE